MRFVHNAALSLLTSAIVIGWTSQADAEIYKFRKPNGQVVYTDSLSKLPPKRRAFYNKRKAEQDQKKRALESRLGKEEVQRREAETKRKAIVNEGLERAERERRLAAIEVTLRDIQQRRQQRESEREAWREKMTKAREKMNKLLKEFQKTQETHNSLAIRADFTLLPGQRKQKTDAKKKLEKLETELDVAINEVQVVIPEAARKAGIPPGWLR